MADVELRVVHDTYGVEFGDQTVDGAWRCKKVTGDLVFAYRTGGIFVDIFTIENNGNVSVNTAASIFAAEKLAIVDDFTITKASNALMKIGPSGNQAGMLYDALSYLQLFCHTDTGIRFLNGQNGSNLLAIDALTKVASFVGTLDISTADGGQIKFPATQNASVDNFTLDDYRQKQTFTPTLDRPLKNASGIVYTKQIGEYTKFGNVISYAFEIEISNKGDLAAGDDIILDDLPYTADLIKHPVSCGGWTNVAIGSDTLLGEIRAGDNSIQFKYPGSNTTIFLKGAELDTGTGDVEIKGGGRYTI